MSASRQHIDTLILPRWLIPVAPSGAVLEGHALAVDGGRILAVLPAAEAGERFTARETIELPRQALIPGLINAHTHAAMNLMRGLADDLPLMQWLQEHIWPAEGRFVSEGFCADGVQLATAEMLRGGTTCFNDMYFFPDVTAATTARIGMRAAIGMILIDFPTPWASTTEEYLAKGQQVRDAYRDHPLISTNFAPHAPYTVSDEPLRAVRTRADEMDLRVHMHVHETAFEVEQAEQNDGRRPLARLADLGLVTPNLLAVHMTQLTDAEIADCARAGVHVLHSPESNLKLASGLCPVAKLLDAGVNVALGTDGAASNNDLDMIGEMRTAALIGKLAAGDAAALPAATVLQMATLNGARALGLDADTGSLEPGKWADCTAIDLDTPETRPLYDPVAQIVYSSDRRQVTDTWVAGKRLLRDRQLTTIDLDDTLARVDHWQTLLRT
ncbi:TRZ/ATZ family hydrolase [Spectribacter hydrogenoxidans]|uniref:5-methylthioadenosine/S-adenosylhomocysteine deaminase n=1 Tax=Spectribacter hydrogenoxidans TaxID=3075608 RepID=A0ABU3C1L5_9GAMM|nr:TRZ/ATZ family hydrolase [Salinisphaera sp. W335]MDT0635447.1 TRZ/ATZ family hydrolase [Salinisphaera sp. W335]